MSTAGDVLPAAGRAGGLCHVDVNVVAHLLAGVLLGLAFCCVILPALCALGGPDRKDGQVTPGWRKDRR